MRTSAPRSTLEPSRIHRRLSCSRVISVPAFQSVGGHRELHIVLHSEIRLSGREFSANRIYREWLPHGMPEESLDRFASSLVRN